MSFLRGNLLLDNLELWFVDSSCPQLNKAVFCCKLLAEELVSFRGKSSGAYSGNRSFQWTSAVQALCQLVLRWILEQESGNNLYLPLKGKKGSSAASLDYALTKKPQWISDLFGSDSKGNPILLRMVKRSNSGFKRGGPVGISLNSSFFKPSSVKIYLDDVLITKAEELLELLKAVENQWKGPVSLNNRKEDGNSSLANKTSPVDERVPSNILVFERFVPPKLIESPTSIDFLSNHSFKEFLTDIFFTEVTQRLTDIDIFNKKSLEKMLGYIKGMDWYERHSNKGEILAAGVDRELSSAGRLGCFRQENVKKNLEKITPLRIYVPPVFTPSVAIFRYFSIIHKLDIKLEMQFPNGVELVTALQQSNNKELPSAFVATLATWLILNQSSLKKEYRPLMVFPSISHRVIAPKTAKLDDKNKGQGSYLLWKDTPSGPLIYFDALSEAGFINPKYTEKIHMESDEISLTFRSGDVNLRSIMWFPFYHFNCVYNESQLIFDEPLSHSLTPQLLFVHQSILKDKAIATALDLAIRDAWLQLMCNENVRRQTVELLVNDPNYIKLLVRFGGLHNLKLKQVIANC